ncbi:hypothetical protein [Streptomyces sp. AK04-3B]|uniref:hypothetical protein n=1 Tax=Streptomyces sp. AK04-3B TaxID=3028650 RepID=UPI0029B6D56F|nr:hypothetical protein [Streptomyces sp. AK04-3B]MDX3801682.1 hypothetical protein [Streptomyces sp. AK04-3B]
MSQEERDARLGLTGLTGAQREARIRLLTEQAQRETAAARAALLAQRAQRASARAAADTPAPAQAGAEGTDDTANTPTRTCGTTRREA